MAKLVLSAPLPLDPREAADIDIIYWHVEPKSGVVEICFDLLDATGKAVDRRRVVADGAQIQTWIANNTNTIYQRLAAKLGVTGTVT